MHLPTRNKLTILISLFLILLVLQPAVAQLNQDDNWEGDFENPGSIGLDFPAISQLFDPNKKGSIFHSTLNMIIFFTLMFGAWATLSAKFETDSKHLSMAVKIGTSFFVAATVWYAFGDALKMILIGASDILYTLGSEASESVTSYDLPDKMFGSDVGSSSNGDKGEVMVFLLSMSFRHLLQQGGKLKSELTER